MTITPQEVLHAALNLLLQQRQGFAVNHLALIAITPNQQGTHEMKDEADSSAREQEMDTTGNQVPNLEDI